MSRRHLPHGSGAEAQAELAEVACQQLEAVNVFFESQWLCPIPLSAFVWFENRLLAYYHAFQHLVTRVLTSAMLITPADVTEALKTHKEEDDSVVGAVLHTRVSRAAGGAYAVLLMHRTFSKVPLKRQADRLGRLRFLADATVIPVVIETVARALTLGRGAVLAPPADGADSAAAATPHWGKVFGKSKVSVLLQGLMLNGDMDPGIRRAQLLAVADGEALLDWVMSRSTPEAREELKRLPPQSETITSRLVTAVTLSRPL